MSGAVQLQESEVVDVFSLATACDCINGAGNPDTVEALEDLVSSWCKEIEQVHQRYTL